MTNNSKEALLATLRQNPVLAGWGAILALGRCRVNPLLEQGYADAFATQTALMPISGEFSQQSGMESVVFDGLVLGAPRLSFEQASGRTARVTVRMPLMAGICRATTHQPGIAPYLRHSNVLDQGLGHTFEVQAKLDAVAVPESKSLQLVLDFSNATDPLCSLGATADSQRAMGRFIAEQLQLQRPDWRLPILSVDLLGYDVFAIASLDVLTQQAPIDTENPNPEDGAVYLLLQLRGNSERGKVPQTLPYLLPRGAADGGNHAASLLIDEARIPMLTDCARALLSRVQLPHAQLLEMTEQHEPREAILFGDIAVTERTRALQPAISTVVAGRSQALSLRGSSAQSWSAHNVDQPRASGEAARSAYAASSPDAFVGHHHVVVVTAHDEASSDRLPRTAVVVESQSALTVSPRVARWNVGAPPVSLLVSGKGDVAWSLVGQPFGRLVLNPDDASQAAFVPEIDPSEPVRLQRVQVTQGDDIGYATIVILSSQAVLTMEPFYTDALAPGESQRFALQGSAAQQWMLAGVEGLELGHIDADGVYTAPAKDAGEATVVIGIAGLHAGVAIIEHRPHCPVAADSLSERWLSLNKFHVKLNNASRNLVYANGRQQVGIDVMIETSALGGDDPYYDPVSDLELSTLVLTGEDGVELPFLPSGHEALSIKPGQSPWAVSKTRNRFDYYRVTPAAEAPSTEPAVLADIEGRRTVTLYVQCLEAEVIKLRAKFKDHRNGWHDSALKDENNGIVQVTGVQVPTPQRDDYQFEAKRVANKHGSDYLAEHGSWDRFNYWHYTTDYWVLSARGVQFVSAEWGNASMIRWESDLVAETYCSYTGHAFKQRPHPDAAVVKRGIEYQAELSLLAEQPEVKFDELDELFKGQEDVSEGTLLITLDRVPNFPYWSDIGWRRYRDQLDKPMLCTLVDNYGNTHRVRVTFTGGVDGRNSLVFNLQ